MRVIRKFRGGLFGAAIAGALGFGATQAFATDPPQSVIPCDSVACDRYCQAMYPGPLTSGYCGPEGECRCAI